MGRDSRVAGDIESSRGQVRRSGSGEIARGDYARKTFRRHRLAVVLWLVVALEIGLRVFSVPQRITYLPEWSGYDYWMKVRFIRWNAPLEFGADKLATLGPFPRGAVRCNRHGCAEIRPDDDRVRVACLGSSTTWGDGVDDSETYPACLERLLGERSRASDTFDVLNLGFPGSTSYELARRLVPAALALGPRFAIVGYGGVNDSMRLHFADRRYLPAGPALRAARSFQIWRLFEHLAYRYVLYPEPMTRVPLGEYAANLTEAARLLRAKGVIPIFLTEKVLHSRNEAILSVQRQQDYRREMMKTAVALRAPVVDLVACFGGGGESTEASPNATSGGRNNVDEMYLPDGIHWSPAGCRRVAECVAAEILKSGAGPPSPGK